MPLGTRVDWSHVWEAAEDARLMFGWTKTEMYARTGVSETTYRAMRNGHPLTRNDKLSQFAEAFGWTVDDLEAIAAGAEPPPARSSDAELGVRIDVLESEVRLLAEMVLSLRSQVDRMAAVLSANA